MKVQIKGLGQYKISFKVGILIVITEVIALFALGVFYINRFSDKLEDGIYQKFQTPGYLMSKGLLRYESTEDRATMEKLLGEELVECMIIGVNNKVYFSLNADHRGKLITETSIMKEYPELGSENKEAIFKNASTDGNHFLASIISLKLDDGKYLGHLFIYSKMDRVESEKSSIMFMFIIGSLMTILLTSVVILFFFNKYFTSAVNNILSKVIELQEGTINTERLPVTSKDELGILSEAINDLNDKLREIVKAIKMGVNVVAKSSSDINEIAIVVANGSNSQASSAEEVSSAIEEMTANIQNNTDNAQVTQKISIKATEGIRQLMAKEEESIEYIRAISSRISIVNDIANQINILALNASVEAARAGEHGRGFAVVAAEVRKLAESSKSAAVQITELTTQAVELSSSTHDFMKHLVPEVEKTSVLVAEISASSLEQNSGANQINIGLQDLNVIIQQNAATADKMSESSKYLQEEADELKKTIKFFNVV